MVDNRFLDYFNALDRMGADNFVEPSFSAGTPDISRDSKLVDPRNMGLGHAVGVNGKDVIQTVQGEIRKGASRIEITMPGMGHGNRQSPTFDMIDRGQREEIRALQELNDFEVSTHASFNIFGLAGFNNQEGFSDAKQHSDLKEVRRAIDFAADATHGGTVVVHSGDFPRSLSHMKHGNSGVFEQYEGEGAESPLYVVDTNTGKLAGVKTDDILVRPKYQKEGDTIVYHKDASGNHAVDDIKFEYLAKKHGFVNQDGNLDLDKARKHVNDPKFKDAWIPEVAYDQSGNIQTEEVKFTDYLKEWRKQPGHEDGSEQDAALDFFKEKQRAQVNNALGTAHYYEEMYKRSHEQVQKIYKSLEYYKKKKEEMGEEEFRSVYGRHLGASELTPGDFKDPIEILEEQLVSAQKNMDQGRETSVNSRSQARELMRNLDKFEAVEDYGVKKSAEGFAKAAMHAYDKTQEMRKRQKDADGNPIFAKPITVAIENVFPEQYGATAEEIAHLVKQTREEFKKRLQAERGIKDEKKLQKLAEDHVKITFDTAHMYMWRKYFKGTSDMFGGRDPHSVSEREKDEAFQKWYLDQVQKLADEGIIGNLHLVDTFGYEDSHTSLGQGVVPLKSAMEILAKSGLDAPIGIEGGWDVGRDGLLDAWKLFGSPVYQLSQTGALEGQHITNFYNQGPGTYSGFASAPLNVVGSYLPSEEWKIWSEVPFE